jgi:acetamidase/formamidase
MIRRVLMLSLISLAAVSAADKAEKYSVNLYQPVVLNGTTFKPGDAKVAIVDGKAVFTQGKVSAQTPVKVETAKDKYLQTKIAYKDGNEHQISDIYVGGTTKHLLFTEAVAGQ